MSIFSDVKENVSIFQAAEYLGLKLVKSQPNGERRYKCPVCETKDPDPLCIGDESFTCYGTGKKPHGDVIALVAHCKQISQTEAAKLLAKHFLATPTRASATKPEAKADGEGRPGERSGDTGIRSLEFHQWEHPVMDMLNLPANVLRAIGGGIAQEDELNDRICIPLRTPDGKLIGYQGIATRADQAPLILIWPESIEELIRQEKREPDEMRKILRLVS
jgi:hypothetical protein